MYARGVVLMEGKVGLQLLGGASFPSISKCHGLGFCAFKRKFWYFPVTAHCYILKHHPRVLSTYELLEPPRLHRIQYIIYIDIGVVQMFFLCVAKSWPQAMHELWCVDEEVDDHFSKSGFEIESTICQRPIPTLANGHFIHR